MVEELQHLTPFELLVGVQRPRRALPVVLPAPPVLTVPLALDELSLFHLLGVPLPPPDADLLPLS